MIRNIQLNESEKRDILNLHSGNIPLLVENVVFTDWVSPDNKYVVFMDQLIEIDTKRNLGDIWKNSDNLFLFLEHVYRTSKLRTSIKEEASQFFSKRLIVESKMDLSPVKHLIKQYIKEGFWGDAWSGIKKGASAVGGFVKDTVVDTVTGITDTVVSGAKGLWNGIKDAGIAISKGDFLEVLKIIGRGYLWVGRKIRQAAYSTVGMIIDAILIATGVGKIAQVVVWAIVVCVDVYELISGDYEHPGEPMWLTILMMGCDVLGLVFAGAAAKAARVGIRAAVAGARTAEEVGVAVAKNPTVLGFLKKIVSGLKDLPAKLASMSKQVGNGFWGKLFAKALDGIGGFIKKMLSSISGMFTKKEMRPVLVQLGLITGIGTYGQLQKGKEGEKGSEDTKKTEEEFAQLMKKQGTNADISSIVNVGS
jgi:hypothetical protein